MRTVFLSKTDLNFTMKKQYTLKEKLDDKKVLVLESSAKFEVA